MKKDLYKTAAELLRKYKPQPPATACLLVLTGACALSFAAGRSTAVNQTGESEAVTKSESIADSGQLSGISPATPSFLFPPYARYADATPSNAEIMDPCVLNLASLYGENAHTAAVTDSYAGRLYKSLTARDAQWFSGIYDLYNYTPEQMAAILGLPLESVTTQSGLIPEFRNISIQFINGDGQAVNGGSNVRDIISMVNVLHYYGLLSGLEEMEAYAGSLWNASHNYTVTMSPVYYCDGSCLSENTPPAKEQNQGETTAEESVGGDSTTAESAAEENTVEESTVEESNPVESTAEKGSNSEASTVSSESADVSAISASPSSASAPSSSPSLESTAEGEDIPQHDQPESQTGQTDVVQSCPGHVDCTIQVLIRGSEETNSLFKTPAAMPSGNEGSVTVAAWDEAAISYVRELMAQDWYKLYGLNTSDIPMGNPLTAQEIELYMKLVPEDASETRKGFIRYALSSVGKIPYYWGGKPSAPGYTGNNFGSLTTPDEDGRLLKGLDCSGWINWVYWSVTGRGLGAQSTGTLLGSGVPITKDQLQPGDICIRTGPMSHVVIFLGWTDDGQMICIQETTGNSNNVEVGIKESDWESYRRIIE